jgi:glutathione S-transferase
MTKLYYSAGACSMSCEIAFEEMGMKHEAILVDWDKNQNVDELNRLNPLGVAPVVVTDKGKTLTQNTAILEYYADMNANSKMLPAQGTAERAETLAWLSFAASDFHKSFNPLFALKTISQNESAQKDIRAFGVGMVEGYLKHLDKNLEGKDYIMGKQFTIADCYLFVVSNWTKYMDIKIDSYKNLTAYLSRVYARPAVQRTMKKAGLSD